MKTNIIAITNEKGGVAKTTTAVHLGAALAEMGHTVAMLDTDPQAHLTKFFNQPANNCTYYLLTMPLGEAETVYIRNLVQNVRPNLSLLPGGRQTEGAQAQMSADNRPISWIRDSLGRFTNPPDFIVIDTGPTRGGILERVIWASDLVIIPTETESLSLDGVRQTIETAKRLQNEKNWRGGILGILPTMVRGIGQANQPREHRESLENLHAAYPNLILPPIPHRMAVAECPGYAQTIFERDPDNLAATAYRQLAEIVLKANRAR